MTDDLRRSLRTDGGREVDEELAFHLEMRAAELVGQGWSPEAAGDEARRQFGDLEDARTYMKRVNTRREKRIMRIELFAEIRQDLALAFRTLRRSPGFALVAALTLALGVGANVALFSVVRGVLLRRLPYGDPDRIALVLSSYRGRRFPYTSPANAADWAAMNRSFASSSVIGSHSAVLTGAGEPVDLAGADVGAAYFDVLAMTPVAGRIRFTAEEVAWQGPPVVVLGEGLWRERFGADPAVVGRMIVLDDERYQVIGVAPRAIDYPRGASLWFPFRFDPARLAGSRGAIYLGVIARLKPGVTIAAADLDMAGVSTRLRELYPKFNEDMATAVVPLKDWIVGSMQRPLLVLLGGVGFVLLIACANVANLLLVRGITRRGELAVRAAMGAGPGRLVRQLTTESMVLALLGSGLGLAMAAGVTRALVRLAPASLPRLTEVQFDGWVFAFALAVAVLTGLAFGLMPGRLAVRGNLVTALREEGRAGGNPGALRARRALVVAEVALSVVLLAGAGLLIRSFLGLTRVDPGFRSEGSVSFALSLPSTRYPTGERQVAFVDDLLARIGAAPGVRVAGAALGLPLTSFRFNFSIAIPGRPEGGEPLSAEIRVATEDYFRTLGIPVIRGRGFAAEDRLGGRPVLLLSQAAAAKLFPGEDPIGRHLVIGWGRDAGNLEGDVVGVVGDVRQTSLAQPSVPQVWAPYAQWPVSSFTVVVNTSTDPGAAMADLRQVIRDVDPALAISDLRPMTELVSESVAQPRFYMLLLAGFAGVALVLSAIGIYSVIAYLVGQRSREIGIRMALGASRWRIIRSVIGEGAGLAVGGLIVGLAGAFLLTRLMSSLLFGVGAGDPVTFVAVGVGLLVVALVAAGIPARRAVRIDPARSIRTS